MDNVEIDNKAIGQRLRDSREKLELSREDFAEIVGLSDYYIGQLERGERQMSLTALIKISHCLHLSLDFLVFGIDSNNKSATNEISSTYNIFESLDYEMVELLNKCSPKEIELFIKLIKTLLPYI